MLSCMFIILIFSVDFLVIYPVEIPDTNNLFRLESVCFQSRQYLLVIDVVSDITKVQLVESQSLLNNEASFSLGYG